MGDDIVPSSSGELLLYQTEDGLTRVEVRFEGETVWLSQNQMVVLFQTSKPNISMHIRNVFEEGELKPEATVKKYLTVQTEGNRRVERIIDHYNLDVIISVGYRVKSLRGTQFRIWATQRLREYIVKGFAMDDERLKAAGGGDYFNELLERIRDIRSSERVFWRKVLDIYATSIDYDQNAETSRLFFQTVQNKMHWAIIGQTAAEIVHTRADAGKPNMGLTSWAGDKPRKGDACIAKNYLGEDELKALNLIVSAYLDFAELQAITRKPMTMAEWIAKLDDFIRISDREILTHAGTVSHDAAKLKAELEYERYREAQAALPQPVDQHFADAVDELGKIEAEAKKRKPVRKKKGGAQ
ncbi:MAG: virulence RhuM family protein [Armatimonadetes bacterium]|nr:virulence RhuM family protein [Armatimonadota bacterium]